jgi:hypothetical protein
MALFHYPTEGFVQWKRRGEGSSSVLRRGRHGLQAAALPVAMG